ncbi:uncharacterized protein LAESUDRAFT_703458 [Laetiporus sulphureus 93-53]|uniref:NADH dehydrogenase [ubiquinone] 1 alpha subcomplex subunit n=1 Tax=Laetiporus sulphureus 93-53 TaxID=1314785 RepID=A0A165DB32_9APHY|nr:uncharacterized protein LAESUDRAFT_703458 [Laetiporus sulphureus 93-53]KZT04467.1 hypothetical protein LAESUDRAFT_703458 [Laetiporus sulphureus 93-53]
MSFIRRIWQKLVKPSYLVGRDIAGNKFYEYPGEIQDPRKTKRIVKYREGHDMQDFISGHKRLAVQWTSWLTHTRMNPPTLEELHADLERQRRVLMRAALIEARDREQRPAMRISPPQPGVEREMNSLSAQGQQHSSAQASSPELHSKSHVPKATRPRETTQYLPVHPSEYRAPPADEPQPWSPRTIRRGG